MNAILNYVLPLALLAAAGWTASEGTRLVIAPHRGHLTVLLAAVGLSALADTPVILLWAADRDMTNALGWLGDAFSIIAAASLIEVLSGGRRSDQLWWTIRHATLLSLALATMAAIAAAGDPFGAGHVVTAVSYLLPYGAYLLIAFAAATVCAVAVIRAPNTVDTQRRAATLVIAAGGWLSVGAALWRQVHLSMASLPHLRYDHVHGSELWSWAGHAVLLAGLGVSAAIARHHRRRRLSQYQQLENFWVRLTRAVPGVVLPIDAATLDVDIALYRRVIEILDAWHLLRAYLPEPAHLPQRHTTAERRIRADAAELLASLDAHANGDRPQDTPRCPSPRTRGTSIDSLARWLVAVARATDELERARPRH